MRTNEIFRGVFYDILEILCYLMALLQAQIYPMLVCDARGMHVLDATATSGKSTIHVL